MDEITNEINIKELRWFGVDGHKMKPLYADGYKLRNPRTDKTTCDKICFNDLVHFIDLHSGGWQLIR